MAVKIQKAGTAARRPFNMFLYGQTKAGKTTGAWLAAMRLCDLAGVGYDKILFIDTEAGRSTYILDQHPELADASVVYWQPPFVVPTLTGFIIEQQHNYEVVIVDSFSAFYSREGGTLDQVSLDTKKMQGNSYVAWKRPGDEYNKFLTAVTQLDCNVIVCARAKMGYEQQEKIDGKGNKKKVIVPVGFGPVVRQAETGYEFDLEGEVLLDDAGGRVFVVRGSRVNSIETGATWAGGFNPDVVDAFMGVMEGRPKVERVTLPHISAEKFLEEWKGLFDTEDDARSALAALGRWGEIKSDGYALAQHLADRRVNVAERQAAEIEAVAATEAELAEKLAEAVAE